MDKTAKIQLVRSNAIIVGVDVAKKKHFARIIDSYGIDVEKPFSFQNNIDGFIRLEGKLLQIQKKAGVERVIVGMEPTGHYWKPLAWWLRERGYTVVIVNPMLVKRHKEDLDNSPSKSDRKDTGIIADLVLQGKFMHCMLPKGIYAELRELAVTRRQQKGKLNAALNNLRAVLDEFFPEFDTVFKNLLGKAASWVLENIPFPKDIVSHSLEWLGERLKEASNHRVGLKRAESLMSAAESSVGVPDGLDAARIRLKSCLREVRFYEGELEITEAKMAEALEDAGLSRYLLSIPGVGVVTAAGFLGEIGDPTKYKNWRQVRNLAGLSLMENSSGKRQGNTIITKRGRSGLRCLLYQAALVLVAKNSAFRALYHYFLTRRQNPLKKKEALIAVGLKLLRVMFKLATAKELYDPSKVLGHYREAQLKAA